MANATKYTIKVDEKKGSIEQKQSGSLEIKCSNTRTVGEEISLYTGGCLSLVVIFSF